MLLLNYAKQGTKLIMIIGTPKEIKDSEYRVELTPSSAKEYKLAGHRVLIEKDAGIESGFSNEDYINVGCEIIDNPADIWNSAEMIIKVKEPLKSEYKYLGSTSNYKLFIEHLIPSIKHC